MGKEILLMSNKREADKVYADLKALMDRGIVFYSDINEAFPWENVFYNKYTKKFTIYYKQEYFNRVKYGVTVPFYLPDWASVVIELKNLMVYRNQEDENSLNVTVVREKMKEACLPLEHIKGLLYFKKIQSGVNTLCFDSFKLDTLDKFFEMEKLVDYVYAGNTVEFDLSKMGDLYTDFQDTRHSGLVSMFRTLQVCADIRFNVVVRLHICGLLSFFRNMYVFDMITKRQGWKRGVIKVYVNTNLRGRDDYKYDMWLRDVLVSDGPSRMTFESAYQSVCNCVKSSGSRAEVKSADKERHVVYVTSHSGVEYEIHCNCLEDKT